MGADDMIRPRRQFRLGTVVLPDAMLSVSSVGDEAGAAVSGAEVVNASPDAIVDQAASLM